MADKYKYFKIEATEVLENLTKGLLDLDKNPSDLALVKELFRYAHTLKGAASVVRLSVFSGLAHRLEDRLTPLREDEKTADPEEITILLDIVTSLSDILMAIKAGEAEDTVDLTEIMQKLDGNKKSIKIVPPPAPPPNEKTEAQISEEQTISWQKSTTEAVRINSTSMNRLTNLSNEIQISHLSLKQNTENLAEIIKSIKRVAFGNIEMDSAEIIESYRKLHEELDDSVFNLEQGLERTCSFSDEMNDIIMTTRLVSVNTYACFFEKAVRDLGLETKKKIDFHIEGQELLLDRALLEKVKEPIYHMLRNSIIHGIESPEKRETAGKSIKGKIRLTFEIIDNQVKISCRDNGRGLDPEKIKLTAVNKNLISDRDAEAMPNEEALYLILSSGFSTAEIITELSGRGVGMDVVKSSVAAIEGNLEIESKKGEFTHFTLILPASVNIANALLIKVSEQNMLIPLKNIVETRLIEKKDIAQQTGKQVISYNETPIPLLHLADILKLEPVTESSKRKKVIIVKGNIDTLALIIDDFSGKKSILLKPLEMQLQSIESIRFATILENGDPAFLLNISYLINSYKTAYAARVVKEADSPVPSILVTDDSLTTRTLINKILQNEGYNVQLANSGEEALLILEKQSFDLLLCDVEMPGINGFELSKQIRQSEKYKDTPIIIMTSLSSDADKRRGIEVGANAYIVKGSFDQESFLGTVSNFI